MAIRFGLEDHQHFKVESQSRNGPKALTGVPGAMRSLGTSLNQTSLTPINGPRSVSSVKDEWASNSKEIHALKAEIKEEMKREVLDSKSKIVDELNGSLRGDMKEIFRKDVAECNAKILGELKDSLLPLSRMVMGN